MNDLILTGDADDKTRNAKTIENERDEGLPLGDVQHSTKYKRSAETSRGSGGINE